MFKPPLEILPPDIAPLRHGNAGVDYVHVFDSGQAGPEVLVQALTHGNEICGAHAMLWLFEKGFRPRRGRLTLALANVAAFERFDSEAPHASRYVDEDLNRVWSDEAMNAGVDTVERRRARELRPFVDAADFVLDIHSMHEDCRPLMVCGTADKNAEYARRLGVPADLLIDTGHPAGLRMVERGGLSDPASARRALLIECGQHWARSSRTVAIDTLVRFLALTGLADEEWMHQHVQLPLPPVQRLVRVTEAVVARSTDFRFLIPVQGLGVVPRAGTPIARDGDQVWCAPYDDTVLVMPSMQHARPGNTQVRLGRYED
ncbi:MAG TPA: succinylglutamate desuccinylase/aspartoacylase family protein [Rubrivivax sp.]|nr:succinylglutamate desuccinylase/aspartoacylase family protein [Burkholderiales bacterium]HNU11951.1 succinylglutamate desuccinylase/aspartoacylase family protein [Rubrivivax sp.]